MKLGALVTIEVPDYPEHIARTTSFDLICEALGKVFTVTLVSKRIQGTSTTPRMIVVEVALSPKDLT